jgi:hypothetical protein
VILVTHDMRNVAAYAERTILLDDGRILADAPTRRLFADREFLRRCGLAPPQITDLAQSCADMGIRPDVISVEEMEEELMEVLCAHAPIHREGKRSPLSGLDPRLKLFWAVSCSAVGLIFIDFPVLILTVASAIFTAIFGKVIGAHYSGN